MNEQTAQATPSPSTPPPPPRAASPTPRSALKRCLLLPLASLAFSLALLALIEGVFRLAGYGGYPPTFTPVGTLDDGSTLVFTDHAGPSSYFFSARSRPGSLEPTALVMPKPENTLRIIMVGGSAAKGSPQPRHLTSSAFLVAMLSDLCPDRTVEVINIGTTAIASYPALGLLTESLDFDPDVIVAYVGNNEFYGSFGVASLHSAGRSPAIIRLIRATRSLAVAQAFQSLIAGGYDTSDTRTLMEAMVGVASIGPDDPARLAAARNLHAFVTDMIDRCAARDVPIIVCTPPANERGLAPLGQPDLSATAPDELQTIQALIAAAAAALPTDPARAEGSLRRLLDIEPDHPRGHYLLATALDAQDRAEEAAAEFRTALDLDPMPWRPPGASVDAIRRAADRPEAVLCDLQRAFRDASPGGVVGWRLMDDHVHPSLEGQALVARTIIEAMASLPAERTGIVHAPDTLSDRTTYAQRLGANPYDAYAVAHAMRKLGRIPFFQETNPHFGERFDAVCRRIEAESEPFVLDQLRAWQNPETHKDGRRPITGMVAMALLNHARLAEAEPLFDAASRAVTPYGTWELQYAYFTLLCRNALNQGLDEEDRRLAQRMIERGRFLIRTGHTSSGAAERFVGEFHLLRGEFARAVPFLIQARNELPGDGKVAADSALVRAYMGMGEPDKARDIVERGLDRAGPYASYYRQMIPMLSGE